ncbi:NmrA family protein [Coniochaeta hoffmannii]|uniref:NmrA family protein n=1 Tax=Coniochaeta hoffmannii TaxID=91930 RepID=A0AA38RSE3_9PEZI|nr:NmrA family protein [Coniochaeta hoffmannii]
MTTYLITQASGQQSRWAITHLLAAGAKIHAVVRNLEKAPQILKSQGITLFQGESTDFDAVFRAAQGCEGAFLNTFPIPGLEAQQAKTIVAACKKAGIENLVAATTFATDNKALWDDALTEECGLGDYFRSKAEVEDIVRTAGFKAYTIVRPAFIHFDYLLPASVLNWPELSTRGELAHAYEAGATMPHTDGNDVGAYVAAALQDPAKYGGREIGLGNEPLTVEEIRNILARVSGRDVRVRKRSPEEVEALKPTFFSQRFQLWANTRDLAATVAGAREVQDKFGIPFTPFEKALGRDRAALLESLPQ